MTTERVSVCGGVGSLGVKEEVGPGQLEGTRLHQEARVHVRPHEVLQRNHKSALQKTAATATGALPHAGHSHLALEPRSCSPSPFPLPSPSGARTSRAQGGKVGQ